MNPIRNERGGAAFLYVLMVVFVLLLLSPIILSVAANEADRDKTDSNALIANQLAVSTIEAFVAYLDRYDPETATKRADYLDAYTGFTDEDYNLPDGTRIDYCFKRTTPENGYVTVKVRVQVGEGRLLRRKEIQYLINVADPSDDGNPPTDQNRAPVPIGHDTVYHGLKRNEHKFKNNVKTVLVDGIKNDIDSIFQKQLQGISKEIEDLSTSPSTCGNCQKLIHLDEAIRVSSKNPLILKISNNVTHDNGDLPKNERGEDSSFTWGSVDRPVILIFENGISFNKSPVLNIYGTVIFKGNALIQGSGFELNVYKSKGGYGDIFITGDLNTSSDVRIDAEDTLYIGNNANLHGQSYMEAQTIVVKETLQPSGNINIHTIQDIIVNRFVGNGTIITGGDMMAKEEMNMNGNLTIEAGGLVATGGQILNSSSDSVYSGGGTTQLPYIPFTPLPTEDDEFEGWNPKRVPSK